MEKKYFLVGICVLLMSGCGNRSIDAVKETYLDGKRTTTVANTLDNRSLCSSTKWGAYKDDKGREVVQYSCSFVGAKDYHSEGRSAYIERLTHDYSASLEHQHKRLKDAQKSLDEDFPYIQEALQRLDANEKRAQDAIALIDASDGSEKTPRMIELEDALQKLEGYTGPYDEQKIIELCLANALNARICNASRIERIRAFMNSLPAERRARYKSSEWDVTLKQAYSSINYRKKEIHDEIAHEARKFKWELKNKKNNEMELLERVKLRRNQLIESLERDRQNAQKEIARASNEIKEIEERGSEENIKKEALMKFPIYEKVTEIFQWIVNKDGEAVLVHGELQAEFPGGKVDSILTYNRPATVLAGVAQSKAKEMAEYMQEFRGIAIMDMLNR